jgi:2-oxoglutarate ferredoxin oxidoreductase subunit delta
MAMSAAAVDASLRRPVAIPAEFRPVLIAAERCKGCGLCVEACAPGVLVLDQAVVNTLGHHPIRLTDPGGCTSCAKCARVCPDAVLTILARPREA